MKILAVLAAALLSTAAAPASLVGAVSSPLNDYNLSFDRHDRTMVFARSEAEFRNAHIYVATRRGRNWDRPAPIAFSDPRWSDSDPWLTPDGRSLYFISNRPAEGREAGRADYDLWRSTLTRSGWSAPERLGPEVNSRGQELGPELHGAMLYFSSARRGGRGGLDIYAARATSQGFAPAALLQGPFNGPGSESDFTLSHDGRSAMFWRDGEGGTGRIHITRLTSAGWSPPEPLPDAVNHGPFNFTPSFARDGRSIFYASTRLRAGQPAGLADVYRARLDP